MQWYVLRIGSKGYRLCKDDRLFPDGLKDIERYLIEADMADANVEYFIPRNKVKVLRRSGPNRRQTIQKPIFHGYLFARNDVARMAQIRNVSGVLSMDGVPVPVPARHIDLMKKQCAAGFYDADNRKDKRFSDGQTLRVLDGPFAGFPAWFVEKNCKPGRLIVDINIFGRTSEVDLEFGQVESV